ncbi:hypothetical protein AA21952_0210 [Acetobacter oeni LMG 21952]|nr:hypothetical protein AA21952_0210 [Acetobacter oeni LMG 21952]
MFDLLNDVRAMAGDRDAWLAAKREAKALEMQQSNLVRQTAKISPRLRNEMFRVASAVGTVAAIVSLCLEVVL